MTRFVMNALALGLLTLFWSVVAVFALPFRGGRGATKVAHWWARSVLWTCDVQVVLRGDLSALTEPSYLVMATHSSHFDVIALYAHLPVEMRPVAKRELAYIPIFGWVLAAGAAIMIDRGNRRKAVASIERAARTIRKGRGVLMFPEGTRTPSGVLGKLKKGPFHLALIAGIPVLPVAVVGTAEVLRPGDWKIRRQPVVIQVGAPIPTAGRSEEDGAREALMAEVESALRGAMASANSLDSAPRPP